ncbi:hypothetical protein O7635_24435 [Asanoa sp. WMMD1127]|uniref:hypothetical protein n=1 Tax=Asanoa sp. WMMD1127 TaxID=3016107 RepID=UPI002416E21A|nr:hypothetical protein [Asanoa sp. WMMD1127]MDG4825009.1 hypothetical protein [Asanoa sp. WMMD1127]
MNGVEVFACRNGFARLIATVASSTELAGGNQVFLRRDGDRQWRVVARAPASVDCGDASVTVEMKAVCAGLR